MCIRDSCKYHITRDKNLLRKSRHYYLVILIFAAGAAAGALLSIQLGERSIWLAALLLMAGFVLMFIKEDIRKESNSETSRTEP